MKLRAVTRGMVFFGLLALGSAASVRADDAPNPKYSAWVKFKPGSCSTVEADMQVQGSKFHITMTKTLVSIDDDQAVVETRSSINMMGQIQDAPARRDKIPAKGDPESFKQIGEKDIDAMGKTFKCRVYESKGNPNAKPDKTGPAGNMDDMKATIYVSDDVPGGLVRLDGIGQKGQNLTFILTGMEVK